MDAKIEEFLRSDPLFQNDNGIGSHGQSLAGSGYQLFPIDFFLTSGVMALAFTGFPRAIEAFKGRLNAASDLLSLANENRGALWAKATLGGIVALGIYAAEGVLLGDARITWAATGLGLVTSVPYDVVLTPFVVPLVGALVRRLDLDPLRR